MPLGEVARVVSGATPKTGVPEYWGGPIPWATPAELSRLGSSRIHATERTLTEAGFSSSGVNILPVGSVLLSSRAPIGLVAINTVPMGTNQGFKSLVPSDRVLAPFLYWWLKSHTALLQSKGRGATFLELSKAEVERLQIPLPPLPEQRRIAAILDEAAALRSTWGETRESARRAISSRISALLSKSTDIKPLAQLLAEPMRNGISPSRGGRYEGEVLTLSAITRGAFDPRQRKSDLFAAPHAADKLAIEGLHLICRGNGNAELVGAMVAVTEQLDGVAFPDTMIGFRPSSEINSPTLVAAWRHPTVRDQLRRAARTTNGTYKVNQQSLSSIMVPVPRREDQEQIAALDAERTKLDSQLAQGLVSLDELFASLQHRAFRGEL
ncbi:restriction endonuclease subunit S [Microbacterium schleiferi]|uniref:restriction endonuclease subunit S n=1 Tax=Microbacterium schleiferi TaxID=69362 RepID=UPI0035C8526E